MTKEQIDRAMRNRGCFALVEFELVLDFAIQIHDAAKEEDAVAMAEKDKQIKHYVESLVRLNDELAEIKESGKVLVAANREHFDAARANYDECVGLRAVLNETQAELTALKELAVKAVYDEPEYPGDMPDDVWDIIHRGVYIEDRGRVAEVLRATVRLTKQGILDRLAAKDAK